MKPLTAENFYEDFKQNMKEDSLYGEQTYLSLYKLTNQKAETFTKFINKDIIPGIIRAYGCSVSHEYFRIDASGWVSRAGELGSAAKASGLTPHLWDLVIAVEHENNPKDWNDEVIKLAHIRCPLKVVIGYNACNDRDAGDLKKLSFVADCLRQLQCVSRETRDGLLVILGNCKGTGGQDYQTFDYRGYVFDYRENAFHRIG